MTYYGPKEMAASFRTVRGNTIKIAEEIPEESYDFRAAEGCRTVAETLVHIAVTPSLQAQIQFVEKRSSLVGFDFFGFFGGLIAKEQTKHSKAEILQLLTESGEKFAGQVEGCSDEFLSEIVTFPEGMMPPTKSRFEMLIAAKEHEMHHRAQLMVIQRMLGMVPPMTRHMNARIEEMKAAAAAAAAGQK
ncbi:MAG: DinB family protein [Candidatus Solibacter sp.]